MPAKLITLAGWGEARDTSRPGVREDAGWSRPSCRVWDASGGSWDELSYWIQVESCVPREQQPGLHCECGAGLQAGAEPGPGTRVPGQAASYPWMVEELETAARAACPVGCAELMLAPSGK